MSSRKSRQKRVPRQDDSGNGLLSSVFSFVSKEVGNFVANVAGSSEPLVGLFTRLEM